MSCIWKVKEKPLILNKAQLFLEEKSGIKKHNMVALKLEEKSFVNMTLSEKHVSAVIIWFWHLLSIFSQISDAHNLLSGRDGFYPAQNAEE